MIDLTRFQLESDAWITDPRRTAPKSLSQLVDAAQMLADARYDLKVAKAEQDAWMATMTAALASKYTKWPKWRVDATVQAEPKFRFHEMEVAKAEQDVCILEAVQQACAERVKLLGTFYSIE